MKKSLMMKIFGVATVAMMLSLVIATPASAKHHRLDHEVPIKGTVTGEWAIDPDEPPPPPDGEWVFTSEGAGQMSHLGRVDFFLRQESGWEYIPEDDDFVVSSKGTITFTAANGDTLVIEHEATSRFFGEYGVDFGFTLGGTWTVDEGAGTGRFINAAGSGSIDGIGFISPYGPAVFDFEGEISYDASNRSTK